MSLTLYYHPLASYCWKAVIALYENQTPFEAHLVNLSDPGERAQLLALWPIGKFPVLRDHTRGQMIPEATIIIEYLTQYYPGRSPLLAADADVARETRLIDRFYDLYVHEPMQRIVGDKLRPDGKHDPLGVEQARAQLETSYDFLEQRMVDRCWAMGDSFCLADCAAAPALYYANRVAPLGEHRNLAAYLRRLHERESFSRVFAEAQPYLHMFPG